MGAGQSQLSEEEVEQMKALTSFDEEDLDLLYRKFQAIDKDKSGSLRFVVNDTFFVVVGVCIRPKRGLVSMSF
jgi:hypothetical protein